MKLNFDIKNKKAELEADVEKLVEKGMDQHEKDWKYKFNIKHNAKKEILELKHKQKMEIDENSKSKKSIYEKIVEEKRKTKELELEEQRRIRELELEEKKRQEKIEKQNLIFTAVISLVISLIGIGFFIAGSVTDPGLNVIGLFLFIVIAYIWLYRISKQNTKDNKKKK